MITKSNFPQFYLEQGHSTLETNGYGIAMSTELLVLAGNWKAFAWVP